MTEQLCYKTVIVADGIFPTHVVPLECLERAERIICADGAAGSLVEAGYTPHAIVGDMDSLSDELRLRFSDRIFPDPDQETNDLTKAVKWCAENGFRQIAIVGATGKREDHTIANISLLGDYIRETEVIMVTDTGIFFPAVKSIEIKSFKGQQVSVFSINPETMVTSSGLLYPLSETRLRSWWCGTLNESTGDLFRLVFSGGPLIIFLKF